MKPACKKEGSSMGSREWDLYDLCLSFPLVNCMIENKVFDLPMPPVYPSVKYN